MYDFLIVGAGLYGAVLAQQAIKKGKKVLVIEKRDHIAGNAYCEKSAGINVHKFGAHIFHTSNEEVWEYVNLFASFNNYVNSPLANYKDYFNDPYQGIPKGGYNVLVENLLKGAEVKLGVDFLENKEHYKSIADKIIYTSEIDQYFEYQYGQLEYRSLKFEHELKEDCNNYQGNTVVNCTEREVPFTRIIEHKHFEFSTQPRTVITREYPMDWEKGMEPYYPINDERNNALYEKYKSLGEADEKVIFGGRLGEYKYYNMDKVIASALNKAEGIL